MNLKLKQLYLARAEEEPADDAGLPPSEPRPLPGLEFDLLTAVAMLVMVGVVVWLLIVSVIDQVSA